MKIKAKKAIIGFASISAVLVAGLGTTLGVLLSQKKTNDTVKITMDNVYSIRDYLFKRYTKVLTDAADSQSYIESQIAKVQSDVDTIIQEGINGSFPAETIYANIYAYGYRINIDIYDWSMLDAFIQSSLSALKQILYSTGLPQNKADVIYNTYSRLILSEIDKCKKEFMSPSEIINHMKIFGQNIAVEALADDYEQLAQYYIDNFATSQKLQLTNSLNYYYDSFKNNAPSLDDVTIILGNVLKYENLTLSSDIINQIYNHDNQNNQVDYQLMSKVASFDDKNNLIEIIFSIKDNIHKDANGKDIIKTATKTFQFYLPYSPHQQVSNIENEMRTHAFNFQDNITFADWGGAFEQIKNILDNKPFPINPDNKIPIRGLMDFMSAVFTVDGKPLKDSDLSTKYEFQLNVYGYSANTNQIDFEILVGMPNDYSINDYIAPTSDQDKGVPAYPIRSYALFPRVVLQYPSATNVQVAQLHQAIEENDALVDVYSPKNINDLQNAFNVQVAYTSEQCAAATAFGVMAGIYYAAAPECFGATIGHAISCTVAAAATATGAVLGGIAAHTIQVHKDTLSEVMKRQAYQQWVESSLALGVVLKKYNNPLEWISYTDFTNIEAMWLNVTTIASELFYISSAQQTTDLFLGILGLANRSMIETASNPFRIMASYEVVDPVSHESHVFANSIVESISTYRGLLAQGENQIMIEDTLPIRNSTTGAPMLFKDLTDDEKNVVRAVVFYEGNPLDFWNMAEDFVANPISDNIFATLIRTWMRDLTIEQLVNDTEETLRMARTLVRLSEELDDVVQHFIINGTLTVDNLSTLKTIFYTLCLDGRFTLPDAAVVGSRFVQVPACRPFYNLWTEFRPGGASNLPADQFNAQFDAAWDRYIANFRQNYDGTFTPITMRGGITQNGHETQFVPSENPDDLGELIISTTPWFVGDGSSDSTFGQLVANTGYRTITPSATSRGTFVVSDTEGDLVAELKGIDGFKAYLFSVRDQMQAISVITKTAIFACPAVEVAVSIGDLMAQIILTILTTTYAPF